MIYWLAFGDALKYSCLDGNILTKKMRKYIGGFIISWINVLSIRRKFLIGWALSVLIRIGISY